MNPSFAAILQFSRRTNYISGDFQYFQEGYQIPVDLQYFQELYMYTVNRKNTKMLLSYLPQNPIDSGKI